MHDVEQMKTNNIVDFYSTRKIKFRLWSIIREEMIYDAIQLNHIGKLIDVKEKSLCNEFSECVWQQFIGIKDCYGVDVYEGDIVEYSNNYIKDVSINLVVKFHDGAFKLWWQASDFYFDLSTGEIKVIGNVFTTTPPTS